MEVSLDKIAEWVEGKVVGDPHLRIRGIASIEEAKPGEITFLANPKYASKAIQDAGLGHYGSIENRRGLLCSFDGGGSLLCLHPAPLPLSSSAAVPRGSRSRAAIGKEVILGTGVSIGPFVTVEDRSEDRRSRPARRRRFRWGGERDRGR
ncbi:MAG: hypothetical protein MPW15_03480 [Candidatus Manganitrophus sp.]|nr:hypothetical protein [Candidatus Manganitrophus sp.]